MPCLTIPDATGHTTIPFDPANPESLVVAEEKFRELTGLGFTPAKRIGPGQGEVIRQFDPTAEEITFWPMLQGG